MLYSWLNGMSGIWFLNCYMYRVVVDGLLKKCLFYGLFDGCFSIMLVIIKEIIE